LWELHPAAWAQLLDSSALSGPLAEARRSRCLYLNPVFYLHIPSMRTSAGPRERLSVPFANSASAFRQGVTAGCWCRSIAGPAAVVQPKVAGRKKTGKARFGAGPLKSLKEAFRSRKRPLGW